LFELSANLLVSTKDGLALDEEEDKDEPFAALFLFDFCDGLLFFSKVSILYASCNVE
jgi:hypothetical protein